MRWSILGLALATLVAGCKKRSESRERDDPLLRFKRLDELPAFELRLDREARKSLEKDPREWVKGRFAYGDEIVPAVGVRLKGHRSMRPLDGKPAIKIRFDKFRDDQRFLGLRHLTLNNMVEDPGRLREILGYRLYRELGVPAPSAFYATLTINGEPYGLYAVIETIDREFLAANFADASGGLYEGEYGCDLYAADVDGFDRDSGSSESRADLRALAVAADGPLDKLFARIDMDAFLAYLAVSAFIGDFDGYRHAHNYRIYHRPDVDKWVFIPWGIDRAFKKSLSIYESYGRLATLCFADAKCRADYVRVQKKVLAAFAGLELDEGTLALAATIKDADEADPRRPKASRTDRSRRQLLEFLRRRPAEIAAETRCIDASGAEVDGDGDGHGCLDCDDSDPAIHPGAAEACDGIDNDCSGAIDDSPTCPTCTAVDGAPGYSLCDLPRQFTGAESYCAGMGGALARIDDQATAVAVAAAARARSRGRWWIGLDDRATEGAFRWPGGAVPGYTRWHRGEPDNSTCNQDCAVIDTERKGEWYDTHCGQPLPFVCQIRR